MFVCIYSKYTYVCIYTFKPVKCDISILVFSKALGVFRFIGQSSWNIGIACCITYCNIYLFREEKMTTHCNKLQHTRRGGPWKQNWIDGLEIRIATHCSLHWITHCNTHYKLHLPAWRRRRYDWSRDDNESFNKKYHRNTLHHAAKCCSMLQPAVSK